MTFSIVAADPAAGDWGVAVASKFPALLEQPGELFVDHESNTPGQSGGQGSNEDDHRGDEQDGTGAGGSVIGQRRWPKHEHSRARARAGGRNELECLGSLLGLTPRPPERDGRHPQDRRGDRDRDEEKDEDSHRFECRPAPPPYGLRLWSNARTDD